MTQRAVTANGQAAAKSRSAHAEDLQSAITEALAEILEHRAAIEQAKGVLMFVYQLDDEMAFELLRWRSQECNVKLRVLAEQLMDDIRALRADEQLQPSRIVLDKLLLTAHERIEAD